jgi:hypothetical protein
MRTRAREYVRVLFVAEVGVLSRFIVHSHHSLTRLSLIRDPMCILSVYATEARRPSPHAAHCHWMMRIVTTDSSTGSPYFINGEIAHRSGDTFKSVLHCTSREGCPHRRYCSVQL